MEKPIKIKVSAKKYIYGKLHGSLTRPLFIVVHGITGNMDDELHHGATKYFYKKGFSTFRFNLYDWRKGARQLIDCTLETHASDLDAVINYFKKKGTRKVFVAGHSFGGPTILLSKKQNFDATVLWDPSYDISFTKRQHGIPGGKYIKEVDGYLMSWGVNPVIGKAMSEEVDSLSWDKVTKKFNVPFKIIIAGDGVLVKQAKNYTKSAIVKNEIVVIPGATHSFDDKPGMQNRVYRLSESWFRKFM